MIRKSENLPGEWKQFIVTGLDYIKVPADNRRIKLIWLVLRVVCTINHVCESIVSGRIAWECSLPIDPMDKKGKSTDD